MTTSLKSSGPATIVNTISRSASSAAESTIVDRYSLEVVLPRMLAMYDEALAARRAMPRVAEPELSAEVEAESQPLSQAPPLAAIAGNPFSTGSPFAG